MLLPVLPRNVAVVNDSPSTEAEADGVNRGGSNSTFVHAVTTVPASGPGFFAALLQQPPRSPNPNSSPDHAFFNEIEAKWV